MIRMKQRLAQQIADVCSAQPVHDASTVTGAFDEAGEAKLGKVLTRDGWPAPGYRSEGGNVGIVGCCARPSVKLQPD
jgi:hypothetical protein